MGTKHSVFVDEYLRSEGFPDALSRTIRRDFERAVRGDPQKALTRLKEGDRAVAGRNEGFILGALTAEVKAEALIFLYGPYFATSSFMWSVLGNVNNSATTALKALAQPPPRKVSSASNSTSSPRAPEVKGSTSSRRSSVSSPPPPPPPAGITRPSTATVTSAAQAPFISMLASKLSRIQMGPSVAVVEERTEPGLLLLRQGSLRVSRHGSQTSVIAAGSVVEVGMILSDEVIVCGGASNDHTPIPRDGLRMESSTGIVYGFLSKATIEAAIAYVSTHIEHYLA